MKGIITSESVIDKTEISTPSKNSSITTVSPAAANTLLVIISFKVSSASFLFCAITTPFPAASPLAFITTG